MPEHIPSFADMFPSRWLKAADIQGREIIATIESIGTENFDRDPNDKSQGVDKRNILRFVGAEKEFILNMTNGKTIFDAYGEPMQWIGKKVVMFVMQVSGPNGVVPGIRLRAHYGEPETMAGDAAAPAPAAPAPAVADAPVVAGNTVNGEDSLPF